MWTSRSSASRSSRSGTERPSSWRHHGWCERPITRWPTPCERAKSISAGTGSRACSRTTSAPSSRASSMLREQVALRLGVDPIGRLARGLDVDDEPVAATAGPPSASPCAAASRRAADTTTCTPSRGRARRARSPVAGARLGLALALEALGDLAQRELAQRREVAVLEEVLERPARPCRARRSCRP